MSEFLGQVCHIMLGKYLMIGQNCSNRVMLTGVFGGVYVNSENPE